MRGAFALGVLTEYEPNKLVAVRQASPLIIGLVKVRTLSLQIFRQY